MRLCKNFNWILSRAEKQKALWDKANSFIIQNQYFIFYINYIAGTLTQYSAGYDRLQSLPWGADLSPLRLIKPFEKVTLRHIHKFYTRKTLTSLPYAKFEV